MSCNKRCKYFYKLNINFFFLYKTTENFNEILRQLSWEESMTKLGYRPPKEDKEKDSIENHCAKSDFKYYIYYVSGHYYDGENNTNYQDSVVSI